MYFHLLRFEDVEVTGDGRIPTKEFLDACSSILRVFGKTMLHNHSCYLSVHTIHYAISIRSNYEAVTPSVSQGINCFTAYRLINLLAS